MIVKVDEAGRKLISDVVNVGLKSGAFGIESVQGLFVLLTSMQDVEEQVNKDEVVEEQVNKDEVVEE